jgi:hypothetical protein
MPNQKSTSDRKYSKSSQKEVKNEMHRYKKGEAHSGKGLAPVKSKKQAVAIGLSKARQKGEKVPSKSSSSKSSAKGKSSTARSSGSKTSSGQTSSRGKRSTA